MQGSDVVDALKRKLAVSTEAELADRLGITTQSIQNWKKRTNITPRQLAGLVDSACRAAIVATEARAIRPLVEFFPLSKCASRHGAQFEIFGIKHKNGHNHPYMEGLRQELERCHGVYIFFDSRGQAIYAGKARKQSLWKEINLAFNRDRKAVQKIRRVKHPELGFQYRTSEEKSRQITEYAVPLHELAAYISAPDYAP